MQLDDVKWLFALPIVSAALLAVLPFFAPPVRWTRRLKNDLEIWKGLPEGKEKDDFEFAVRLIARRLHAYRFEVRAFEKVIPWTITGVVLLTIITGALFGVRLEGPEWALVPAFIITSVLAILAALRGQSSWLIPAEETREYERRMREGVLRTRRRAEAQRRLRRIRKAEKKAAKTNRPTV